MTWRPPSELPEGLLYAVAAFGLFAFGCVEPWSLATLQILVFLLALACFARGGTPPSRLARWAWLVPAAFAALGALQLCFPARADGPRPLGPFTAAPGETEAQVLVWLSYAALVWSVPRTLLYHVPARRCARVLFALGVGVAALGLLQELTGSDRIYWLRDVYAGTPFSCFYDRDDAANAMLLALCLGAGLMWSVPRRFSAADGPTPDYLRTQGRLAAGLAVLAAGLVVSGARGAPAALPPAAALLCVLGADFARGRRRALMAAGGLAAGAAAVFLALYALTNEYDSGARVEFPIAARLLIYGDAWRWLRDAPFFGTGLGSFAAMYPSYQDSAIRGLVTHAHSDWLELALETGGAGLLFGAGAAAALAWRTSRVWVAARSSEMRAILGGALLASAAFGAHVLVDFCFHIPGNAVYFLAIAGLALSAPAWADKAPAARSQGRGPAAAAAGAAIALTLCWFAARPALVERDGARALADRADALLQSGARSGDAAQLRAALKFSLAALKRRPYDSRALALAGESLALLKRPDDAAVYLVDAGRVRFVKSTVDRP